MNAKDGPTWGDGKTTPSFPLDEEIKNILVEIEREPIPHNLIRLAEQLQTALQRKRAEQ
ncbi:MAG: hypothetical protein H0T56_11640 [Pseudaminobacter sp.]|nr:hypothetical protein [Pseudaminobacter sp.]